MKKIKKIAFIGLIIFGMYRIFAHHIEQNPGIFFAQLAIFPLAIWLGSYLRKKWIR